MIYPSMDSGQSYLWLMLLCAVLYLFWFLTTNGTRYWRRVRVPYIEGRPLVGNFYEAVLMRKSMFDLMDELYVHERVRDSALFGISKLTTPTLVLRDPELIKQILIKDAAFFCNRTTCTDPHGDLIGYYNLLMIKNPAWKQLRSYLTPSLSLSKIKQMYRLLDQLNNVVEWPDGVEAKKGPDLCHVERTDYPTIRDISKFSNTPLDDRLDLERPQTK